MRHFKENTSYEKFLSNRDKYWERRWKEEKGETNEYTNLQKEIKKHFEKKKKEEEEIREKMNLIDTLNSIINKVYRVHEYNNDTYKLLIKSKKVDDINELIEKRKIKLDISNKLIDVIEKRIGKINKRINSNSLSTDDKKILYRELLSELKGFESNNLDFLFLYSVLNTELRNLL